MWLDMITMFIMGFIGALMAQLFFNKPKRRRTRMPKTPGQVVVSHPPITPRQPRGPYTVSNKGRKPVVNDDEAGWRKENDLALRE